LPLERFICLRKTMDHYWHDSQKPFMN
jgi:hypothetical protein